MQFLYGQIRKWSTMVSNSNKNDLWKDSNAVDKVDEFRFNKLNGNIKDEVLDLKNDVLKLCDNMDDVKQRIINLNAKIKFNNRETLLIIEDLMEKVNNLKIYGVFEEE